VNNLGVVGALLSMQRREVADRPRARLGPGCIAHRDRGAPVPPTPRILTRRTSTSGIPSGLGARCRDASGAEGRVGAVIRVDELSLPQESRASRSIAMDFSRTPSSMVS
jgi:hypothetical protein